MTTAKRTEAKNTHHLKSTSPVITYPLLRKRNANFASLLEGLSEAGRALSELFKIGVLCGPPLSLLSIFLYLHSESIPEAFSDAASSIDFLFAISISSAIILVIAIMTIMLPAYSELILKSSSGYSAPNKAKFYPLHFMGLLSVVICYPLAAAYPAIRPIWQYAIPVASLIVSLILSILIGVRSKQFQFNWGNAFQLLISLLMINLLGAVWILGGFVIGINFWESELNDLSRNVQEFLIRECVPADSSSATYIVLLSLLIGLCLLHFFGYRIGGATRAFWSAVALILMFMVIIFPGAPTFAGLALRATGTGGGLPITLVPTAASGKPQRYGCLILATSKYYAIKETGIDEPCQTDNTLRMFERIVPAQPESSNRIIPVGGYERWPRFIKTRTPTTHK